MAVVKGPGGVPVFNELPSTDDIMKIKPTDANGVKRLYAYLRSTGMENPVERMQSNKQFLAGFSITPGTPGYEQALNNLVAAGSKDTATVAFARRVATKTEILSQVDGNPQVTMVRIADGPDPCPACLELSGIEGTYEYFQANDLEPPAQCYGSSNCMCILQKIN